MRKAVEEIAKGNYNLQLTYDGEDYKFIITRKGEIIEKFSVHGDENTEFFITAYQKSLLGGIIIPSLEVIDKLKKQIDLV